jgi:hypothetical protein
MYLTNCFAEQGTYGDIQCISVGNRVSQAQSAMNGQMVLSSCSQLLTPTVPSPLIRVANWSEGQGNNSGVNQRLLGADAFDSINKIDRKWIYTPARAASANNDDLQTVFKPVSGDAGTSQSGFAWLLESTSAAGRNLRLYDQTLPSTTSGCLKILVRARSTSAGSTLAATAASNLGGGNITTWTLSTNWQTYSVSTVVPSQWGSGGTTLRHLQLFASANTYILAVAVIDESPAREGTYSNNSVGKALTHTIGASLLTSGSGTLIARGASEAAFKVKAFGYNEAVLPGYASVYGEFIVQATTSAGVYAIRGVNTLFKQLHSINAGVISLDVAITAAVVGGQAEITATPTITGSAGATTASFIFEIEALGIAGVSIVPA